MRLLKNVLKFFKKYKAYIVSGIIGATLTLIAYPIQKYIDYGYWKKQEDYLKYVRIYDRKINLIDEFNTTLNLYLLCSWKTSANVSTNNYKSDNLDCYWESRAKLNSLLYQADLYFGNNMSADIEIFKKKLEVYENGIADSFRGEITSSDMTDVKYQDFFASYLDLIETGNKLTKEMYKTLKN